MVKTSLVEAYDDRDVIRQISKLTDEVKADTEVITEKASQVEAALPRVEKAVEDAEDASTKAQAAAATALGIGDRVTAVENSTAQNHSDITVHDGEITDIQNDLTNVVRKVTSDVQKVNKGLRVGEVPSGDDVVISRKVLQDFIDAYASMVRTTGAQRIAGQKSFVEKVVSNGGFFPTSNVIDWTGVPSQDEFQIVSDSRDVNDIEMTKDVIDNTPTFRGYDMVMNFYDTRGVKKQAILRLMCARNSDTALIQFYNGSTWRNL